MPELIEEQEDFFVFYKNAGENFHSEDGEVGFFQSIKNEYGEVFPVEPDFQDFEFLFWSRNYAPGAEVSIYGYPLLYMPVEDDKGHPSLPYYQTIVEESITKHSTHSPHHHVPN